MAIKKTVVKVKHIEVEKVNIPKTTGRIISWIIKVTIGIIFIKLMLRGFEAILEVKGRYSPWWLDITMFLVLYFILLWKLGFPKLKLKTVIIHEKVE